MSESKDQPALEAKTDHVMTEEERLRAVRFPITAKPQLVMDERTGQVWFGLNLSAMGKLEAVCQLDQAKIHLLAWYKRLDAAPKVHPAQASAFGIRNGLRRIMGR